MTAPRITAWFDISYLRCLPNVIAMAPSQEWR